MFNTSVLRTTIPYHIISYGALLGTTMYQSFVAGPVAFKALGHEEFGLLQSHIFPVFFRIQAALPVVIALTFPFKSYGTLSIAAFASSAVLPLINIAFVTPWVTNTLCKKKILEEAEGVRANSDKASEKLKTVGSQFARAHGVSMVINLLTLAGNLSYALVLASHIVVV